LDTVSSKIQHAYEKLEDKHFKRKSKYFMLYEAIKQSILKADLPANLALTPSRVLAKLLGLSRSTVLKAYELLSLEGYITAVQGSGYLIRSIGASSSNELPKVDQQIEYPALSAVAHAFLKNVGSLNTTDDKSIGFRPGLPPLDIFPVNQWKNLSNSYWRYVKSSALTYSPSSGNEQLKKSLTVYLNLSRGIKCESSQIIIVAGSLQSLYLLGNVIVDPGDTIITEDPTFPNVKSIFSSLRSQMMGVPIDEQGIQLSEMDSAQHKAAKLVHLTPSNHYPMGVRMSMERRMEVLEWANRNQALIIENEYEHEVNNYSESLPSIFSLDKQHRTIFLGTFNRLLHPSIRVGYMVLPPYLIDAVEALLKHSHRFVSPSIQVVLNQFIEKKYIYSHIKNVVEVADRRKRYFINAYNELFGERMPLHLTKVRSLHLLAKVPAELSDRKIRRLLEQEHIMLHALSKCSLDDPAMNGLIFGYSSVREQTAGRKLHRMAEILKL
jgi:GntR family transcriptional regulator/MocR family aminotransferase